MDKLMKFWPLAVAAFFVISSVVSAQIQIGLNKAEIVDLSESIDEMEDMVDEMYKWLTID